MDPEEVPPVPGWYATHPTDHELYKYARTEGAPDLNNYQLAPYGNGQGYGQNVGYYYFNPAPASPQYAPIPSANQPGGMQPNSMQPNNMQQGSVPQGYPGGYQNSVNPTGYQPQQVMSPKPDTSMTRNQPMQGGHGSGNYRSGTPVKPASSSQYKPAPVQRSRTGR
jgi:pilus assembly protein CpaC